MTVNDEAPVLYNGMTERSPNLPPFENLVDKTSLTTTAPAEEDAPRVARIPITEDAVILAEAHGGANAPRTLVVLHGGPGLSHHYTRAFLDLAGEDLQVVVFDQRGVGASTPMDAPHHSLTNQVEDLEVLRENFALEQMIVLGHSWGGLIGMGYAAKYPERVAALVLVDTLAPDVKTLHRTFDAFDRRIEERIAQGYIPAELPEVADDDGTADLIALLPAYFHDPLHEDTTHLGGSSRNADVLEATHRNSAEFDYREQLSELRAPSIIFHGASDPFGMEGAEEAASALANSLRASVIIERCGHIPWEECPEPFFSELKRFLAAPEVYEAQEMVR